MGVAKRRLALAAAYRRLQALRPWPLALGPHPLAKRHHIELLVMELRVRS